MSIDASAVPLQTGGVGRYLTNLIPAVASRGDVEVVVVARRDDGARWRALAPAADVIDVAPVRRAQRLVWEQRVLARVLRRRGVDVHHAPHYTMPERAAAPVVVTVHDLTFVGLPTSHQHIKPVVFRRAIGVAARRASAIICVSRSTESRLRAFVHVRSPVHVVPHGVDHDVFRPEADPADQARLDALAVRRPYALFLGALEPRKDVPTLINAWSCLARHDQNLSLVLAGSSQWGRREVSRAMSSSADPGRIIHLGHVDDTVVPTLLRHAGVVVYPSREEGFGLPVVEALACGAPVVTTRGSAMEEIAGEAAVLVAAGDVQGLAAAMRTALSTPREEHLEERLGVARRYDWARCATAHVAVYRSLM